LAGTRRTGTRADRIIGLDGRSPLAQAIRDMRNSYLSQCPQPVSPCDAALAERAAILNGHLLQMDQKALQGGGLQANEVRLYTTLSGQLGRILKQLNSRRTTRPTAPSIDELFSEGAAA
jgi:hypothetical protein